MSINYMDTDLNKFYENTHGITHYGKQSGGGDLFSKITNPETGRRVSVYSKTGNKIIRNYLQFLRGGANREKKIITFKNGAKAFKQPNGMYQIISGPTRRTSPGARKHSDVESEKKTSSSELDIQILKDETSGRMYSYNNRTGESLWVGPEANEESKMEKTSSSELDIQILKDDTSGRMYSYNNRTGESLWVGPEANEESKREKKDGNQEEEKNEESDDVDDDVVSDDDDALFDVVTPFVYDAPSESDEDVETSDEDEALFDVDAPFVYIPLNPESDDEERDDEESDDEESDGEESDDEVPLNPESDDEESDAEESDESSEKTQVEHEILNLHEPDGELPSVYAEVNDDMFWDSSDESGPD